MNKYLNKLIFWVGFLFISNIYANETVITNMPLWREVSGWEEQIQDRKNRKTIAEINEAMSAEIVPWRIAVIQGENWSYQWGFFAWYMKGWVLTVQKRKLDAYDALINASLYLPKDPPPYPYSHYYWYCYIKIGRLCEDFGRYQDAEWYFDHALQGLTTNDSLYFKVIVSLADLNGRQGKYTKAKKLYDELFRLQPLQRTSVWDDYIILLFSRGSFEEGVAMILQGITMNGISPKYVEQDYFVRLVSRYWHFFRDIDVIEYYELLGEQLTNQKLKRGNEDLFAFFINTRKLIAKIYPEIFSLPDNDLAELKKRLTIEKMKKRVGYENLKPGISIASNKTGAQNTATKSVSHYNWYSDDTNTLIEKAVNRAMYQAALLTGRTRGRIGSWENILFEFNTNQLSSIYIDGVSALFLAYSQLGTIYCDRHELPRGRQWLEKALGLMSSIGNQSRLTDVLLWMGDSYLNQKTQNLNEAEYYLKWADDLIDDNVRQIVQAKTELAQLSFLKKEISERISGLQELVDKYGCTPRQRVFERLARDYYRLNERQKGFEILVEGVKRVPLKMSRGRFNHMIAALIANRSFHTLDELQLIKKLFLTCAMRVPTSIKYAPTVAKMISMSNESWIDEHIKLAEIEESYNYSNENWLYISNTVFKSPSIRAGLLYIKAQEARDTTGTNCFDWSGWIKGWNVAEYETKSKFVPIDSGVNVLQYKLFIDQFIKNRKRINRDMLKRVVQTICNNINQLNNIAFNYCVDSMQKVGNNEVFALHYAKIIQLDQVLPDDPSFQAMLAMRNNINPVLKQKLLDLLKRQKQRCADRDAKNKWEQLLEKFD